MNDSSEDPCGLIDQPLQFERFVLVAIVGTTVAVINIIENVFLCFTLFAKKTYRSSHCLYLALLAFFDVMIAGAYIPLMSLNHIVDYYKSVTLLRAWFAYMIPMITISHIAMTASSFLMVAASFERFCVTVKPQYTKFLNKHRCKIAFGSVILGFLTKITHGFEFSITFNGECQNTMLEYSLEISPLAQNETYMAFWKIWIRSVFTVLLPFFLLAFMNIRIVVVIQRAEFQFISAQKLSEAKRKSRIRAATRTLVFIVFTYLMSNVLNVIITIWEYIDYSGLTIGLYPFYMFSVDLVSFLTIFAGALRLPIYAACQKDLRREFLTKIKNMFYFGPYKDYNPTAVSAAPNTEDVTRMDEEDEKDEKPYAGLFVQLGTVLIKKDCSDETIQSANS